MLVCGGLVPGQASAATSFLAPSNFAAGSGPYSVAVGDLDNDGRPDLVTANAYINTVSVLLASGAQGNYASPTNFATGTGPSSVAIGDLNNDGRPDLVTSNLTSNDVSVLLASGAQGNFAAPTHPVARAGTAPYSVAIGDLKRRWPPRTS